MLYVSRDDGSVLSLDLRSEAGLETWRHLTTEPGFHQSVRGLALADGPHRADLPVPRRFRVEAYDAEVIRDKAGEPVAECVRAWLDDVLVTLTMHLNGRTGRFRVDLDRRGKVRFRPAHSARLT